jgi:small-conductance mechanosensitive channel
MWFSFPEGCTSISIERQEFMIELANNGVSYFRAPDHFAPRILAINGFAIAKVENLPPDLPQADPLRDGAIGELTRTLESQRLEIQNLHSDLTASQAILAALTNEKANLAATIADREKTILELREALEDK